MAIARWNGEIIAESGKTEMVEGNHYFPPESVHAQYLRPSETTSFCPWKGAASYYTLHVKGADNPDAAWFYPEPSPEAANIRGHVAFWKGVEVSE
jgi:uncharacterized protein (DUF427 family)